MPLNSDRPRGRERTENCNSSSSFSTSLLKSRKNTPSRVISAAMMKLAEELTPWLKKRTGASMMRVAFSRIQLRLSSRVSPRYSLAARKRSSRPVRSRA